ncbi:aminoacyl-tRNA hydrolase [Chloroflexota bacterium]
MYLIVGLGNPGRKYEKNRHNLGFMCLNHFARAQGIRLNKSQGGARTGSGEVAGCGVLLARPQTYMNESGLAVSRLAGKFKISTEDLIVIHDDLDLPVGKMRIRQGGGSGGHKGINSIVAALGSQDFTRLRVGIGRPSDAEGSEEITEADIVDYVLSDFTGEEKKIISQVIPRAGEATLCLLTEGVTVAMNRYN